MIGTWIVAGLIAAVGLAMIALKTRDAFASPRPALNWPTVDRDQAALTAPQPPLAAGTSPDPAAGGAPHRKRYNLGELMPTPERVW